MKMSGAFPSKYMSAGVEVTGKLPVVMSNCGIEEVGQSKDRCPVLYFQGQQKGLVLNRTNGKTIATMYGDETDAWMGKPIELFATTTEFRGETKPCIRVSPAAPQQIAPLQQAAPQQSDGGWAPEDDGIPV